MKDKKGNFHSPDNTFIYIIKSSFFKISIVYSSNPIFIYVTIIIFVRKQIVLEHEGHF